MDALKKYLLLAAALFLSGCGGSGDDEGCTAQYSTTSEVVGESGLVLEPASGMYVTFQEIEGFYMQVQLCMNVSSTGPIVTFLNFSDEGMGGSAGIYSLGTQHVYINTDDRIRDRSCESDRWSLKHEFVHHSLIGLGLSFEDNINHQSPFFGICT